MVDAPGRNDPCPCGSGKKYKKCCLSDQAAASAIAPPVNVSTASEMQVAQLNNTANQLRLEGRCGDALVLLQKAIELNAHFAPSYFNRGMVHYTLKDIAAMQVDFDRAVSLDSSSAEMLQKMAIPFVHLNLYARAENILRQALKREKGKAETWLWLARVYFMQGDDERAYATLDEALLYCPGHVGLKLAHALYLSRVPQSREVIEHERKRILAALEEVTTQKLQMSQPEKELHFLPTAIAYCEYNIKPVMQALANFLIQAHPQLTLTAPHCAPGKLRKPGLLRIGFVSESASAVTVWQFITGIMQGLKQDKPI